MRAAPSPQRFCSPVHLQNNGNGVVHCRFLIRSIGFISFVWYNVIIIIVHPFQSTDGLRFFHSRAIRFSFKCVVGYSHFLPAALTTPSCRPMPLCAGRGCHSSNVLFQRPSSLVARYPNHETRIFWKKNFSWTPLYWQRLLRLFSSLRLGPCMLKS